MSVYLDVSRSDNIREALSSYGASGYFSDRASTMTGQRRVVPHQGGGREVAERRPIGSRSSLNRDARLRAPARLIPRRPE